MQDVNMLLDVCLEKIQNGEMLDFSLALDLAGQMKVEVLAEAADGLRRKIHGDTFDLCSIINAKSGRCSENCKFCAQSSHYKTKIEEYPLVEKNEALRQAKDNEKHGVARFSLVSAGRSPRQDELSGYGRLYETLQRQTSLSLCASMGMLTTEKAEQLRSFGVVRYHCNLEACRSYFPKVCSTHTWEEKVRNLTGRAPGGYGNLQRRHYRNW